MSGRLRGNMDTKDLLNKIMESVDSIGHINASDIPNIDLYMDQVTTFMEKKLKNTARHPEEDKVLTKTMINNYAKNRLLPPPVKKKYSKEHMLLLLFICLFWWKNGVISTRAHLDRYKAQFLSQFQMKEDRQWRPHIKLNVGERVYLLQDMWNYYNVEGFCWSSE